MKKLLFVGLIAILAVGCGSSRKVSRIDSTTTTDLSGQWNDTDARLVAQEMVADCLSRPWIDEFLTKAGTKPVVTVGTIRNMSSEHINTEVFTADIERELLNSGRVKFVASKPERQEIRDERQDQKDYASPQTMKQLRAETGADFLLTGAVKTIVDQIENKRVVFYQTDLQLINIETNEKAWIGTKEIKKEISKGSTKW
ncbi:MAG: penicillin-binding protein activator LpoB [candidate division Zixibacteria bacterium]|nr:penicillin-binding protein activator LpoB [candidate division Zixibacteria bacterium]